MNRPAERRSPSQSNEQVRVRTVYMRGGSSKAVFLEESDVPRGREERSRFLLALFGSPDKRQIDGLGGADLLTSKAAIMGPPTRPDADIDYTFVQVSVEHPVVSYDIACGNITAAAGVYAVEEGYVRASMPVTVVRVHNTNTGKLIRIELPIHGQGPAVEGTCAIDGVPGTGAEIMLDFSGTAGAATGRILPTGRVRDRIVVPSLGKEVEVSIVDVANACVFIDAAQLGLAGSEHQSAIPPRILDVLEEIRVASCRIAGIDSYLLPFQVLVSAPHAYADYAGRATIGADRCDIVARLFCDRTMHKAYAGTGGTCLAVAAGIAGTVVEQMRRPAVDGSPFRIGHPSGILPIACEVDREDGSWVVRRAVFSRTARRLMDGYAYVRKARLDAGGADGGTRDATRPSRVSLADEPTA